MKLVSVKSASEIQLEGIKAEFVKVNDGNRILLLTDVKGRKVHITRKESYTDNIDAQVPAPPKMEEKWQVLGDIAGVLVCETFDKEHEAQKRLRELQDVASQATLRLEPVQVEVSDE